ncbi:hypothetical protein [Corynebacterium matruchotii]|uniref:hypothetical protein n=1 Tax=Corynebacterium matruchotii TaxID=43768 RepID=UPI0028E9AE04|nr:hypothetical protein [Corynebacterium matruchotii]
MTTITVAQLLPVRHRCCGTPGSTALTSAQLDPPASLRRVHLAGPTAQRLLRSARFLPPKPLPAPRHTPPPPTSIPNHARNQQFSRAFSPDAIEYNYA